MSDEAKIPNVTFLPEWLADIVRQISAIDRGAVEFGVSKNHDKVISVKQVFTKRVKFGHASNQAAVLFVADQINSLPAGSSELSLKIESRDGKVNHITVRHEVLAKVDEA